MTAKQRQTDTDLVVFDLDGTLVDSLADITEGIHVGLRTVGGPEVDDRKIHRLIGRPLAQMLQTLLPDDMGHLAEQAAAAYREFYIEHCADGSSIYPGVEECLAGLNSTPLAVATTKMTYMAEEVLKRLGLADVFELILGSDGIPHKPDPAILFRVLEKLGKKPGRSWMVGDTTFDIEAGQAAGMRTVAVTYGIGVREELEALRPDFVLDSLKTLPTLI